jgi:hypothetical protein
LKKKKKKNRKGHITNQIVPTAEKGLFNAIEQDQGGTSSNSHLERWAHHDLKRSVNIVYILNDWGLNATKNSLKRLAADSFLTLQYIHFGELDTSRMMRKVGTTGSYVHIYDRKRKSKNIVQTPIYYYRRERQMRTRWQLIFHPRV